MDEDGPGWEMQDENERRRWEEEQALERSRQLTVASREEAAHFEKATKEFWESMRSTPCQK